MTKRTVEIFTAGCPVCDETVRMVEGLVCPSCELVIHELRTDPAAVAKARQYGITRLPAVVVDGTLAECCRQEPVSAAALRALGVGVAR